MTAIEAINGLKPYIDNIAYTDKFQDVCRTAIEALEKQIPKKPLDKQTPVITWAICPACKGEKNTLGRKANRVFKSNEYCPDCGQKLDWSEIGDTNG